MNFEIKLKIHDGHRHVTPCPVAMPVQRAADRLQLSSSAIKRTVVIVGGSIVGL